MSEKNLNLGYCPLRKSTDGKSDYKCNKYCSFFVPGLNKCVLHGINRNLGMIKAVLEKKDE